MKLERALSSYGQEHIDGENNWYNWKRINDSFLPRGIRLPPGNDFKRNVVLKNQLRREYLKGGPARRKTLTSYYINRWGGIRRNSQAILQAYSSSTPRQLIALGKKGVASWSKALVIRNPRKYAIYDARVAVSLNCLQILKDVGKPKLFPLLETQNKNIKRGNQFLRNLATKPTSGWVSVPTSSFYRSYLALLDTVSKSTTFPVYTLEMLLFAKAEELLLEVGCPRPKQKKRS